MDVQLSVVPEQGHSMQFNRVVVMARRAVRVVDAVGCSGESRFRVAVFDTSRVHLHHVDLTRVLQCFVAPSVAASAIHNSLRRICSL